MQQVRGGAGVQSCRCKCKLTAIAKLDLTVVQTEVQASSAGTTWSPRRSAPPASYQERLWQCGAATKSDREGRFLSRGKLVSPLL